MSPPVSTPRIAIVGAGWAGLAAAVDLAGRGAQVSLFESAKHPGGRARRVDWNGIPVDNGQHLLVGAYRETLALLAAVGVNERTVLLRLPMRVEVPGRFSMRMPKLPSPLHLAAGLLGASGVSLGEKQAAVSFIRALQSTAFRLPEDESVADWLDRHGQRGALREHLWESLCLAALNTHPAEASAQVFANVLRETLGGPRAATDFLLPRVDLGAVMPDAALRHLSGHGASVRCATRVEALRPDGAEWKVETGEAIETFDHVVLATGPQHAAALLPADPRLDGLRDTLAGLAFEPIATAYLRYPDTARLPWPILAISRPPAQWIVDRGQLDARASGLFAHVLSAHGDWENIDDAVLVHQLDVRMRETLPECADLPPPLAHFVIRERRATFRCTPGMDRPPTATALPGLWLAGDYVQGDYPGTLESAVISGRKAAAALAG